jgi:hypothetical protein
VGGCPCEVGDKIVSGTHLQFFDRIAAHPSEAARVLRTFVRKHYRSFFRGGKDQEGDMPEPKNK